MVSESILVKFVGPTTPAIGLPTNM